MRNKKTELTQKFGMKVRLERTKRRLSQEVLADMADLSKKSICAIEAGATTPSIETANDIANAFKIPLHEFLYNIEKIEL